LKSPEHAGEKTPTLAETIETIRPSRAGLLLEIKAPSLYPGIEADVAATMRAVPGYVDSAVAAQRLVVQSFDLSSMATFKELEPTITVGLLGTPSPDRLPELAACADQINPHHKSIDAAYVDAVHDTGMYLVWTVDAVANMDRAIDMDSDALAFTRAPSRSPPCAAGPFWPLQPALSDPGPGGVPGNQAGSGHQGLV